MKGGWTTVPEIRQIILEGSGGQGLGLGGKILAEAAVAGGLNASQSQSYGAQARGGFSSAEVVISPEEIIFPLVDEPDAIVALTSQAYSRYKNLYRTGKLLLYDTGTEKYALAGLPDCSAPTSGAFGFPFGREAKRVGNPKGITLLALGTLVGLTGIVDAEHFEEAVRDNFSPTIAEANLECFRQGLRLAREVFKPCC